MTEREKIEGKLKGQVNTILRDHFGKGPNSMHVQWAPPFITLYLQEFLAPIERTLWAKQGPRGIEQLRHEMMDELLAPICTVIEAETTYSLKEFYYDWDLHKDIPSNGMLWGIIDIDTENENMSPWPGELNKELVIEQITNISKQIDKEPEEVHVYWLGSHELVIEQVDILLGIEHELIKNSHEKILKTEKTALEKKLFVKSILEKLLKRTIQDVFVDWNFQKNKEYMIIRLQKRDKSQ